jgi:hypothetical protein
MVELYSRKKLLTVDLTGKDELTAKSWLDDGIHEIQVILICQPSTSIILSARVEMIHYPWNLCLEAAKSISLIEGMKIGPGVRKEIEDKIGKRDGCFHMADLVIEAIRGLIQGQYRLRYRPTTTEKRLQKLQSDMKGTCFAYSNPELKLEPVGDWIEGNLLPEQYAALQKILGGQE